MNVPRAILIAAAIAGAISAVAVHFGGYYGYVLFLGAPLLLGFASSALLAERGRHKLADTLGVSAIAALVVSGGWLIIGAEGFICVAMTLPLLIPLALLGATLGWLLFSRCNKPHPGTALLLATALVATAAAVEPSIPHATPVYVAEDSMLVYATPADTWRAIVNLRDVAPANGLLFRAGAACPRRTKIVDGREGGRRVCTLSTGVLMEQIDVWKPGERLAWRALSTPPPMKELTILRDVDPPHLHGYYRNIRGEFALEQVAPGVTRLTRRTWYSHDLYPSLYWRLWCDYGATKIQHFVLEEVKRAAERGARI